MVLAQAFNPSTWVQDSQGYTDKLYIEKQTKKYFWFILCYECSACMNVYNVCAYSAHGSQKRRPSVFATLVIILYPSLVWSYTQKTGWLVHLCAWSDFPVIFFLTEKGKVLSYTSAQPLLQQPHTPLTPSEQEEWLQSPIGLASSFSQLVLFD